MTPENGRRALTAWLALCHLLLALAVAPPTFAQSGDDEPPLIEFEPLAEGRRGDTQVFSAKVSDDVAIESVTLRYRLSADESYRSAPMVPLAGTAIHSASIEIPGDEVSSIQYYIEAKDTSGNRSIEGFAFDPLERRLVEQPVPIAQAPASGSVEPASEVQAGGMSTGRKVLYGVLGVVAIGAIAAAASGGGGSDGGTPQSDDPGVNVRVVVDPLR